MLQDYINALQQCYPHHHFAVRPKKVRNEVGFRVFINGEGGDLILSEDDIRSAIKLLRRGK